MTFIALSYGSAALSYAVLTAVLLASRQFSLQGHRVLVAVGGTALWGAAIATAVALPDAIRVVVAPIADAARALLWIVALLAAMPGQPGWRSIKALLLVLAVVLGGGVAAAVLFFGAAQGANFAMLVLSTVGCLIVEQIFRNATPEQKRVLKPFLWTIGCLFIYDLFAFADSTLFAGIDPALWAPRGFLAALAVPFFVLAAKRHPDWTETLFVSRELVFYSATLMGVGIYLLGMAVAALVIREIGGQWGASIQIVYLAAALGVLAYVLSSARLKTQLKVFISKHFYRNRYDYRDEWLRLIRTLSDSERDMPIDQRSIKALAEIVGSRGGQLWLDREGRGRYEPFGAWQAEFPRMELYSGSALIEFLRNQQWVIDSAEYAANPDHYQHAFRDDPQAVPPGSLIVPLMQQNDLLAVVRLERPGGLRELNFEDHDLLKTAGRQVAAFLAHDLARERLGETQQFEAFNKLSAFVMHDIKNLLAQQALLVNNAKKFRDRPEFVDDVISTVDSGVQRMRRLLRQLEQGAPVSQQQRVELGKLLLRAVSAQADRGRIVCSVSDQSPLWVRAHPEQLSSVLMHVIQNAQEATAGAGNVEVRMIEVPGDCAQIEVRDTGEGMSEEFIRRKLFKPFETTKGSSGMGIGAYQAREIVRGLGGELSVASEIAKGTVVTIVLPLERRSTGRALAEA